MLKKKEICENVNGDLLKLKMNLNDTNTLMEFSLSKPVNLYQFLNFVNLTSLIICVLIINIFPDLKLFCLIFAASISIYQFIFSIQKEVVLIISNFGLQVTKFYGLRLKTINFISWKSIEDVVVNEVIFRHKVIYMMTIIKKCNKSSKRIPIPIFEDMLPRLNCLLMIYRNVKSCN